MKTVGANSRSHLVFVARAFVLIACTIGSTAIAQERGAKTAVQSASYSVSNDRTAVPHLFEPTLPEPTGRPITAQGKSSQTGTRPASPLTTLFALLVVIGIVALVWRLIKKGGGMQSGLPTEAVEVLGHKVLAHRQAIQIVRIGTRILVLNSSADGLSTLSEITDPAEVSALEQACRSIPASNSVVDIFAPRQKTATHRTRREAQAIRSGLHRDPPMGDIHA